MGCQQKQHAGFTRIYNSKGASLWRNCEMLSTLLSQCQVAKLKEVDQLAGKTMTQCHATKVRLLSPKGRSCCGV